MEKIISFFQPQNEEEIRYKDNLKKVQKMAHVREIAGKLKRIGVKGNTEEGRRYKAELGLENIMEKLDKLAQIKRKDHFIQLVYKILFVAHDTNDFEILIYWLNTMARIYVLFEDYSHAIYLYEQIVRLSYIKKSSDYDGMDIQSLMMQH